MASTEFDALLDTFESDLEAALASSIEPGCNMPCISVSERHPGLWAHTLEATDTGIVSALGGEEARKSDGRFKHLVFFPTFSSGEMAFFRMKPGAKAVIDAASADTLKVTGPGFEVEFPNKIVVIVHDSLPAEAVKAFYAA